MELYKKVAESNMLLSEALSFDRVSFWSQSVEIWDMARMAFTLTLKHFFFIR